MDGPQLPCSSQPVLVSRWLARLDRGGACPFPEVYGSDHDLWIPRAQLLRRTLARYHASFGDREVRVFRAPGRINLRGMHVDTHGGYLNLMTHHREVVVVASRSGDDHSRFVNTAHEHGGIDFTLRPWRNHPAFTRDWQQLVVSPEADGRRAAWGRGWGAYVEGALLRAAHALPSVADQGLCAAVGSDLPAGASLSSSAALGVAVLLAALGCRDASLPVDEVIRAARDAEWFTGSRCGVSDQAAIVLGRRGQYVHAALHAAAFTTSGAVHGDLPEDLAVLVADSRTARSISGDAKLAYTRNRFAYSMALEIMRLEMTRMGLPAECVKQADRLSRLTPEALGGDARIYEILLRVPAVLSLAEMRTHYTLPALDDAFRQYFGDMPPEALATGIALRGPLLYGLAESERARLWPLALQQGDYDLAGRLMTIGHDGDRVVDGSGAALDRTIDEDRLHVLARQEIPIALCPGDYGASTPVLDGLVDAALSSGALGASLTGAGLAGCILALCRLDTVDAVAEGLRRWLGSDEYTRRTGSELAGDEAFAAVVTNHATAGACVLALAVD